MGILKYKPLVIHFLFRNENVHLEFKKAILINQLKRIDF